MRREKALLEERQKKMQHVLNRAKVGEERTRKRLAKERAEAASKLHEKVRREKRELQACAKLQAFYRGHLGRKAARRWAVGDRVMAVLAGGGYAEYCPRGFPPPGPGLRRTFANAAQAYSRYGAFANVWDFRESKAVVLL